MVAMFGVADQTNFANVPLYAYVLHSIHCDVRY